jgi:hypothetical protein
MSLVVPPDLAAALEKLASQRRVAVDVLLREVIESYLRLDESFRGDLAGWERITAEALDIVEKGPE